MDELYLQGTIHSYNYTTSASIASAVLNHTPIDITGALGGTNEESTSEYVGGLKVIGLAMSTLVWSLLLLLTSKIHCNPPSIQ